MKRVKMLAVAVLLCAACGTRVQESRESEDVVDSVDIDERERIERDSMFAFVNSVRGHREVDTLIGEFVKGRIDTVTIAVRGDSTWIAFDEDSDDMENGCWSVENEKYYIHCSNPAVKDARIETWFCPQLVAEGDLDADGTDDVGYLYSASNSNCRNYYILTIRRNRWVYMVDPIPTSYNLRASGYELAYKGEESGFLHVRFSDYSAPCACCNDAPIVDSVFRAKYVPIEKYDYSQSVFY